MSSVKRNVVLVVTNMTCAHCETAIEQALLKQQGIISVNAKYSSGKVQITFEDGTVSVGRMKQVIEDAGYHVKAEQSQQTLAGTGQKAPNTNMASTDKKDYSDIIGIVVIIFAVYMIAKQLGLLNILYQFPVAKEGMGYGILFLIGLMTSVHCVGMCGGICLSQCVNQKDTNQPVNKFAALRPSLLYNTGRVLSYTLIGGFVGALGSVISFSGTMKGIVQIFAGIFMVIMGINMLGVFPSLRKLNPRMPKFFARKIYAERNSKSPFYIGLLNGLMPCGPLQAMQLYALSTGSPLKGALSMFLFSIGTVPLLFALGALSSYLNKKFTSKMMSVSAVLVIVMGLFMFNYGTSLSGIVLPGTSNTSGVSKTENIATIEGNVQNITTGLSSGRYEPIVVQKGIPVKWTIQAEKGDINGCNNAIVIQKLGIQKKLAIGDNVIEFTPTESGVIGYSCWMGMIRSNITVVDDLGNVNPSELPADGGSQGGSGGCCSAPGTGAIDKEDSNQVSSVGKQQDGNQSDLEILDTQAGLESREDNGTSLDGQPVDGYQSDEEQQDFDEQAGLGGCCD